MNEENKRIIIMECSLGYSLSDERGQKTASGDAQAQLGEENLSKKLKFHEFSEAEQQLLFKIDPYANAEVNNYQYKKNYLPETRFVFENLPKEIVPQPIPETEIYAKPVKIGGYSNAELEFYNPTSTPQVIKLIKNNPGIFTMNPSGRNKFQRLGWTYLYHRQTRLKI